MPIKIQRTSVGTVIILCSLILGCIFCSDSIRTEMSNALNRCLTVIIPSLYAMMILSCILTETGLWQFAAKPFRHITSIFFGLPDGCFALLILSQIAGYPIGAGMLRSLTEQGNLTRADSCRLACVCYGSGPAFLLGLLGNRPHQSKLFLLVFLSCLLTNLLLTVIIFQKRPVRLIQSETPQLRAFNGNMLINATDTAGRSLLKLCGIILCFSAGTGILRSIGVFELPQLLCQRFDLSVSVSGIAESFLEVTNAATLCMPAAVQLPLFAGLISFGGLCVLMQVVSAGGEAVSMKLLLTIRLAAGGISAGLCSLGLWLFPELKTAAEPILASAAAVEIRHEAVFPSVMLVVMMLFVFREAANARQINPKNP